MSAESPTPNREIAYRLFAAEYDDSTLSHAESDEERAPNYVITPTGARLNRLFVVGTLTEISPVNDEMLRARVVDPTGAFVVYAGQYQPDELAALEQLEPPEFVAITGKARTFQPEDSEQVYTSIRPESIAPVDAETRDRWVVSAAEQTIDRLDTYAAAAGIDAYGTQLRDVLVEAGVDEPLAQGIPLAQEHYGTTPTYLEALRTLSIETVEVIAGDRETAGEFDVRPNETTPEGRSFEEIAAAGDVDIDETAVEAVLSDVDADDGAGSLEGDTAAPTTTSAAEETASGEVASGESVSDEVVGSASGSEPETAELSTEVTSNDDEPAGESAARDVDGETDDGGQSSEEAAVSTATVETDTTDSVDEPDITEASGSDDASTDEQAATGSEPANEIDEEPTGGDAADVTSSADPLEESDADEDADDADLGDFDSEGFDDGMYEMDDEEREELEAEFGAEFSTGAEVDEPGSADIEVPDDEEPTESTAEDTGQSSSAETVPDEPAGSSSDLEETADDVASPAETDTEQAPESVDEPDEEIDVQAQVIETMNRLDDGDGADRSTVVSEVADETGAAPDDVEDAIQDALMGGQCYEPDDETLKAI
ncbi:hypothetical protein HALLA_20525 (plasmid) [Halostagnicola larsenii XH-48]|uniref:Rpa-associated protein n=1 Tax=Halostagnicola larsenii XH-48 TaxID=797299 RepID=W0JYN2_9EURY|nr:hypothetical protein [Halostagnicola larsenii]AHG02290.1 hypothetical protein HALLA_20525 [Halostagnicola larsenii XH-48]